MRLFGKVDGVVDRFDRAWFGMAPPFDLAFTTGIAGPFVSEDCRAWGPDGLGKAVWTTERNARAWGPEGIRIATGVC